MEVLAHCLLAFCLYQWDAPYPGKFNFDFVDQSTGEILLVRWLDPEHTLNVARKENETTCWIFDGEKETNCDEIGATL